jgi:D,D-heptose 1,7-bisphosphate phosphatase
MTKLLSEAPEQAVILVGGFGSRLGTMTADRPKPLLDVAGRPFLDYLVDCCRRFGFRELLLLAGHRAEQVARYVDSKRKTALPGFAIDLVVEPRPLGTAGAVRHAMDRLAGSFFLLNGDSLLDANWLDLVPAMHGSGAMLGMALRRSSDVSRFGVVETDGERIQAFKARGSAGSGLINAGVYLVRHPIVADFPQEGSLEYEVLPRLAERGLVHGRTYDGFFLDIGTPEALGRAQLELPQQCRKPAVFFDRDGTLVLDRGYVHRVEDLTFMPGAIAAIKRVNDVGRYAFLVTNQSGVARGYFAEADVQTFNAELQRQLRAQGAHLDDIRYCPYHPEGRIAAYRCASNWRKPATGMFLDLMGHWPILAENSIVVGDQESDIGAARALGMLGLLYSGGNLDDLVAPHLAGAGAQDCAGAGVGAPARPQPGPGARKT